MITNFFIPELNNHDVQELWFQQDGATCHTARATIDLLKDTFGYVKPLVYADKPQTLDYLEDNIRRVIADIRPQMLEKVIENWTSRLDYIRASRDSPMPQIIFKIITVTDSPKQKRACGSLVVNLSDHGRHVMSSSPVPLNTRRVGQRCTLNLSRAETSPIGVVVRRGGASSDDVHVT
ncbi:hypothetical protein TNCV_2516411 [Trichonephila clavipes]|nr:hypothetical protein TNCV_2516411 [Trichonephila clavipes]